MGFRIDRFDAGDGLIVLLVSGRLNGEHVDTLGNALREESGAFAIDLKNVSVVDGDAVQLLVLAESNGTELKNCPKYIREWINQERAAKHGEN
jgi:anti-anti-sigma regulatory factor